jgi:hypothetical protein
MSMGNNEAYKPIQELHASAMNTADEGFIAKRKGLGEEAKKLFEAAFKSEQEAALWAVRGLLEEPSRSVLLRSAASLAMQCDKYDEAEKLICIGLSGYPPYEIAEEFRDLLERVNFSRHLKLRGITLDETELQLVVAGKGVSSGMVKGSLILDRLEVLNKLTIRTAERIAGKPFRGKGSVPKDFKNALLPYYSASRAASYAVTIKFGEVYSQMRISSLDASVQVVEDILQNIELLNDVNMDLLKKNFQDDNYFNNFLGLSKELAPDGDDVDLVGFTIVRNGEERKVQFTRKRKDIGLSIEDFAQNCDEGDNREIQLSGRLSAANDDQNSITLSCDGQKHQIIVPEGLADIVKKYWGEQVIIKGLDLGKKKIRLIDIDPE